MCNKEARNLARLATSLEVGHHVWLTTAPANLCLPLKETAFISKEKGIGSFYFF